MNVSVSVIVCDKAVSDICFTYLTLATIKMCAFPRLHLFPEPFGRSAMLSVTFSTGAWCSGGELQIFWCNLNEIDISNRHSEAFCKNSFYVVSL